MTNQAQAHVMFVGAFPSAANQAVGGQARSCQILMESSFRDRFRYTFIDSTQTSNPPPRLTKRIRLSAVRLIRFTNALVRLKPDVVLLFAPVGLGLFEKGVMARLAKFSGIPAVFFPRGAGIIQTYHQSKVHRVWIGWVFRGTSVNCCQGPAWQKFFVEDLRLPAFRAPIVYNWTATPELISVGSQRRLTNPADFPQLLFLGWLEQEKGVFELLQACVLLTKQYSFRLTLAGSGHAELAVREYIKNQNLQDVVTLVGWVSKEALPQLLGATDVLVLPSWTEGFPNAVVEGMASGVAIVTTSVGAIPDLLTDGLNALIVPPHNVERLTNAVGRVLNDVALRTKLQASGHRFASENFTPERAAQNLSAVINGVIESKGP